MPPDVPSLFGLSNFDLTAPHTVDSKFVHLPAQSRQRVTS